VADNKTLSKKLGLTPGKAVLIGVLGVALIGVIYIQFGSSGAHETAAATPGGRSRRPVASRAPAKPTAPADANATALEAGDDGEGATTEFDQSRWSAPELSTVVSYDPFALPQAFPQPPLSTAQLMADGGRGALAAASAEQLADELQRLQSQLDELKNRGVHVIVSVDGEYVAMIGDRMLHVGDQINDFTVMQIDPGGVRVERKEP
jgi:hypothetical protein